MGRATVQSKFVEGAGVNRAYVERLDREVEIYSNDVNVHGLPAIYETWSREFVEPKLKRLGVESVRDLFLQPIRDLAADRSGIIRVVSIGSGNGDIELDLAQSLHAEGVRNIFFTLVEINQVMQARARSKAATLGLTDVIETVVADFNAWVPARPFDIAIANHSLHHVVALEHLLDQVFDGLASDGSFIVSDMIGRNGHARWPEAADIVRRLWKTMPDRYKFNHQLQEQHPEFPDWDCSAESFEGIRSQDLLPNLLARFHPTLFFAFANISDIFVDRSYGPNFDPSIPEDVRWIHQIGKLDDVLLDLGVVSPTHLMARFRKVPSPQIVYADRTPSRSVRQPDVVDLSGQAVVQTDMVHAAGFKIDGPVLPLGRLFGMFEDHWVGPRFYADIVVAADVSRLTLVGYVPDGSLLGQEVSLIVNGAEVGRRHIAGAFSVTFELVLRRGESARVSLASLQSFRGDGDDRRSLSFIATQMSVD
jgi:SAM-dependent methyltransferase